MTSTWLYPLGSFHKRLHHNWPAYSLMSAASVTGTVLEAKEDELLGTWLEPLAQACMPESKTGCPR